MSLSQDADLGGAEVLPGSTTIGPVREDTAAFVRASVRVRARVEPRRRPRRGHVRLTLTDWAAASAFRWSDPVHVSRAPGRLDVMGGIADYSGSLVLQMPLAEACHVALQRTPTDPGENATITVVSHAPEGADRDDVYQTDWTRLLRELDDAADDRATADADARRADADACPEARDDAIHDGSASTPPPRPKTSPQPTSSTTPPRARTSPATLEPRGPRTSSVLSLPSAATTRSPSRPGESLTLFVRGLTCPRAPG